MNFYSVGGQLANKADSPGVHVDGANQTYAISEKSVARVASAVEYIVNRALQWAERNPYEFYAFLVFMAFAAILKYLSNVQVGRGRIEYDNERNISRSKHSAGQKAE